MILKTRLASMIATVVIGIVAGTSASAEPYHKTSATVDYKCLFNHELLIITHNKDNSKEYIQSYIEKLRDTDVDAVMCCPTAWRTNLYPSEVDPSWKKYSPGQPLSKFRSYDYAMCYLHSGGDPVRETLEACRKIGKGFFISYRMNDGHYIDDLDWPTHNAIWREHPEYWLGDTNGRVYRGDDRVRVFNYMLPEVREYYFSILRELCTNYDVDGVELDFQRHPRFFYRDEVKPGSKVMTGFVKRIREMLDETGRERGKSLKLCVRVPHTLDRCTKAGLDVPGWDAMGLVDMVNISSSYIHSIELDIEKFRSKIKRAKLYGEMNYVTAQLSAKNGKFQRRYTTVETYRASALNLFQRGVDGLSLFNFDYVPKKTRLSMTEGLKRITDVAYLETVSKNYVISRGFGSFPAKDEQTVRLIIPDDAKRIAFQRAVLRVETKESCKEVPIGVWVNGKQVEPCDHEGTELFAPVDRNDCYPAREMLKFYAVPLDVLIAGVNEVRISNLDRKKSPCVLSSLEIGLYR